jgi:hypothetical protein
MISKRGDEANRKRLGRQRIGLIEQDRPRQASASPLIAAVGATFVLRLRASSRDYQVLISAV